MYKDLSKIIWSFFHIHDITYLSRPFTYYIILKYHQY